MRTKTGVGTEISVIVGFVLVILSLFRGFLVEEQDVLQACETQGFTEAKVIDNGVLFPGVFGCSGGDAAYFEVEATNFQGKKVEILVCAGWPFKGFTIRSN